MHGFVLLSCDCTTRYSTSKGQLGLPCWSNVPFALCMMLIYYCLFWTYFPSSCSSLLLKWDLGDAFLNQNGSRVSVDFCGSGITSFGDLAQRQIHNDWQTTPLIPSFAACENWLDSQSTVVEMRIVLTMLMLLHFSCTPFFYSLNGCMWDKTIIIWIHLLTHSTQQSTQNAYFPTISHTCLLNHNTLYYVPTLMQLSQAYIAS